MKKLLLIALIILIIYFSGCIENIPLVEGFSFKSGSGTCGNGESNAEIKLNESKIIFSGYVVAPAPCYNLKASYSLEDVRKSSGVIVITITEESFGDVCVQCLGKITFNGEIPINKELWESGNYGVKVIYNGEELAKLYNYEI